MPILVLSCPQCAAPLPRQARWRMVACPHCGSMVTRSEDVVPVAPFKEAWARAQGVSSGDELRLQGRRYRILAPLGRGATSEIFLAERTGALTERAVIKVAREGAASFDRELEALRTLDAADSLQRLPQPILVGRSAGPRFPGREVLALRHLPGHWGTLADYLALHPEGMDPRHAVWVWRRALGTLALTRAMGWVHGQLSPEHLLLHPRDHGVLVLGWSQARLDRSPQAQALDLVQTAWCIRAGLCGAGDPERLPVGFPAPLAALLERHRDLRWAAGQNPASVDFALQEASKEAFGPPCFIPFIPQP